MEKLSFVIPCYGSEHTIDNVVKAIKKVVGASNKYLFEIILVNDYSPDNVWERIKAICAEDNRIKGINFAKNFGQHAALMAGYNYCTGDYIITIDDDGQTPIDQVFILLNKLQEGYDVVYGKYAERKDNIFRKFGTAMNNFMLTSLIGKPKDIHLTSYFVARCFIIKKICEYKNAFPYIWGLILRTTKNIGNAIIEHKARAEGESGYTFVKLLSLWMNGFTAFSVKPLRISTFGGILFAVFGFLGLLYTIIYKFINPDIQPGYSSLMSVLLIIGGLVLVSLGLIGEYVGRIYLCINVTPQFVIKEIIDDN